MKNLILLLLVLFLPVLAFSQGQRIETERFVYTDTVKFNGVVTLSNTSASAANPNVKHIGYASMQTVNTFKAQFGDINEPTASIDSTNGLVVTPGYGITLSGVRKTAWDVAINAQLALYASFTPSDTPTIITGNTSRVFYPWNSSSKSGKYTDAFNHSTGTFTVPEDGYYYAHSTVSGINNSDNSTDPPRDFFVSINGVKQMYISTKDDSTQSGYVHARFLYLDAGDILTVRMYHESSTKFTPQYGELTILYYGAQPWQN
jgi:hypothetical protein